jgi:hypothetical protein
MVIIGPSCPFWDINNKTLMVMVCYGNGKCMPKERKVRIKFKVKKIKHKTFKLMIV